MIDRHPKPGYGRLLASVARPERSFKRMLTSYVPCDAGPREFYAKLGFRDTGESRPNGECLMDLAL